MTASLKLLVIEDDQADYLLITRYLRRAGLAADCTRVASALELAAALESGAWDAVLADYSRTWPPCARASPRSWPGARPGSSSTTGCATRTVTGSGSPPAAR